jgi:hypothetical protein
MTAESGNKPGGPAQADYSKFRSPPEKEDFQLSAAGQALLASIEEPARPKEIAASLPRIINRMAKLWKTPRQMDLYFDELLTDARGNRKGFPLGVLMELSTLKDYYQAKVFPTRTDSTWGSNI